MSTNSNSKGGGVNNNNAAAAKSSPSPSSLRKRELGPNDVLCGRDRHSFNNVGNRQFRIAISLNLPRYVACKNRTERSRAIHLLHKELLETYRLRFYKRVAAARRGGESSNTNTNTSTLIELDWKQSREKVAHALRDAASHSRSCDQGNSKNKAAKEQQQGIATRRQRVDNYLPSSSSSSRRNLDAIDNRRRGGELHFLRMFGTVHGNDRKQEPKYKSAIALFNQFYDKFHKSIENASNADDEIADLLSLDFEECSECSFSEQANCAVLKTSISPSLHGFYSSPDAAGNDDPRYSPERLADVFNVRSQSPPAA